MFNRRSEHSNDHELIFGFETITKEKAKNKLLKVKK